MLFSYPDVAMWSELLTKIDGFGLCFSGSSLAGKDDSSIISKRIHRVIPMHIGEQRKSQKVRMKQVKKYSVYIAPNWF